MFPCFAKHIWDLLLHESYRMSPKESCYLSDVKQLANTVDLAQTGVGLSVQRLIASNNIFDRTSLILVNYKRQEWLFVPRETQDWNLSTIQTILRHSFDFDPQTWSLNANCPLESDRFALTGSLKAQCRRCWRHQWYDKTSHFFVVVLRNQCVTYVYHSHRLTAYFCLQNVYNFRNMRS